MWPNFKPLSPLKLTPHSLRARRHPAPLPGALPVLLSFSNVLIFTISPTPTPPPLITRLCMYVCTFHSALGSSDLCLCVCMCPLYVLFVWNPLLILVFLWFVLVSPSDLSQPLTLSSLSISTLLLYIHPLSNYLTVYIFNAIPLPVHSMPRSFFIFNTLCCTFLSHFHPLSFSFLISLTPLES